jgi:hypothetical protein
MALNVTHRYDYKLGPIEQVAIEVLNDRYGRIAARRWHASRNYAIELATLDPEAQQSTHYAWRWLYAAGAMLLGLAGFIAYLKYSSGETTLLISAGGIVILAALTALFFYLFVILSTRRIVFRTRYSGVPLVEIPIPVSDRKKGQTFSRVISQLAQKNLSRVEHYSENDLRAGELRMLRRLSEEGAIASATYDKAKMFLLRLAA